MNVLKTKSNSVQVLDAKTGNLKLTLPISGELAGNAQLQGDTIVVQFKEGASIRTKLYDARTGNLKASIP